MLTVNRRTSRRKSVLNKTSRLSIKKHRKSKSEIPNLNLLSCIKSALIKASKFQKCISRRNKTRNILPPMEKSSFYNSSSATRRNVHKKSLSMEKLLTDRTNMLKVAIAKSTIERANNGYINMAISNPKKLKKKKEDKSWHKPTKNLSIILF